jgi:hypothetical protein
MIESGARQRQRQRRVCFRLEAGSACSSWALSAQQLRQVPANVASLSGDKH